MKVEITISRAGATGYQHSFPVRVKFDGDGGYTARVSEDVVRMRESYRTGEAEWEHTNELEFEIGDRITLSAAELAECRTVIVEASNLVARAKERIAA